MTTIAYRKYSDRVEFACDSRYELENRFYEGDKFSLLDKTALLVVGDMANLSPAKIWQEAGFPGGGFDALGSGNLLVFKGGHVFLAGTTRKTLTNLGLPYYGLGSGGGIAVGAMACGKYPGESIAMIRDENLDCWTGGEVHQFRMGMDGTITKMESL